MSRSCNLDDDLLGVAEALGKAIDSVAVSLRYPEPNIKRWSLYPQLVDPGGGSSVG